MIATCLAVTLGIVAGCGGGESSTTIVQSDASTCGTNQTLCGNVCADFSKDHDNCGACGTTCKAGEVCSSGACAADCGGSTTKCGNTCTNTQHDPQNCGACGTACKGNEFCSAGKCTSTCGTGTTACGGSCVDTKTDSNNCGGCGTACAGGKVCVSGTCSLACGQGSTLCTPDGGSPYCAQTQTDNNNCGSCSNVCGNGMMCSAGQCKNACGQGETLCANGGAPYCSNLQTDEANCGACGNVCPNIDACTNGNCTYQVVFPNPSYTASKTFTDKLTATSMTLAWDGTRYWSSSGGSSSGNRYAQYDSNGGLVSTYAPGLDFRSIFTAGGNGTPVYARQYNSAQIYKQSSPGTFGNAVALAGGTLDLQAAVVFNSAGTEFVENDYGTINRWNANNATFIGTVSLATWGTLNSENGYPQGRGVATASGFYLTYSNGTLSAWSVAGRRVATTVLTGAGTTFDSHFSLSYANGMVWVVDVAGGTWRGYNVGL
jgi:hypothetical protein